MARDINKERFPEETILKLNIFAECFREWFPVFLHNPYIKKIHIFDFFAGSGSDSEGNYGSPLVLLNEAKGDNRVYCAKAHDKNISFTFNEADQEKIILLRSNIENYIAVCKKNNSCHQECIYLSSINLKYNEFQDLFYNNENLKLLNDASSAKFILLDQYGFKEVNPQIFIKLVHAPKTDFIFFISSSFIKRFKDIDSVKKYIDTSCFEDDKMKPKECHRVIANYFESLIPLSKEYYLHHFTIQKGSNYYGLIFGSHHTLGMEKFLKVCWKYDSLAGESNCNINDDYEEGTLFYNNADTYKKTRIKEEIKNKILSKEIKDNITGLKFTLKRRCLPKIFIDVVDELLDDKKIRIIGEFNKQAANIHRTKQYFIEIII